jgi:hypothetical protein
VIYIHAQNLGLREEHIKTLNILDAKAEHFSWLYKLSDKEEVKNQYTVAVQLPEELADTLIWEYIDNHSDSHLSTHINGMLCNEGVRKMWREQLELSVQTLCRCKAINAYMHSETYMAKDIEKGHLDDHEQAIFDLLDAVEFPRWAEVSE